MPYPCGGPWGESRRPPAWWSAGSGAGLEYACWGCGGGWLYFEEADETGVLYFEVADAEGVLLEFFWESGSV